jgi:probable HAF family extracellular repeat protein
VGFYTVSSNQLGFYSNSTGSTLTALPTFGGSTSVATAVNGNSATFSVVGQSQYTGAGGALRAFLWSNSSPSVLTALGTTSTDDGLGATGAGATSMAYGINASGLVVGYAQTTSAQHAFVYATGSSKMYDLGVDTSDGSGASTAYAINSSGVIVGQTDTDSSTQAFIYSGYNFAVTGGTSSDTTLGNHFLDIGSLDGTTSSALAINTGGDVVGTSSADAGSASHAFLYEPGGSMQDLNDLTTLPVGWTLDEATGINNAGDITGIADDGTSEYAFLLTPSAVPEPASIGVVCIGGGLLLLKRRRQALS